MSKRCIVTNSVIEDLAIKFPQETIESVKGLVELWQDKNNKDWDTYPSASELSKFKKELRKESKTTGDGTTPNETEEMLNEALSLSFETKSLSTIQEQSKVDLAFDPMTKRDRVSLIAQLFSNEVSMALQENKEALEERIQEAEEEGDVFATNELREELNSLDRFSVIKALTPSGIFTRVKETFEDYVSDTEENRIQAELNVINSKKGSERYTDEQKYEAAKKKAAYKELAYNKIIDNFRALAEESSIILLSTERLRISLDYLAPTEATISDDVTDGEETLEGQADDFNKEESHKDGWMTNFREISPQESLSQDVRKLIATIPKLDYNGKVDRDDLGNLRFLDSDYVHATLIDKLRHMTTSGDMIPLLETLSNTKPWVKQVIKKIQSDDKIFSQFYQDFRKDFIPYWIHKRKMQSDGTYKMTTIAINKPEGIYYLLDEWRDNYEWGNLLDDDSIYDNNGDLIKENAAKGLKWTETLNNKFSNLSTEQRLELLKQDNIWKTINKLLNMIGVSANQGVLLDALTNIKSTKSVEVTDPIITLLTQLNVIFTGVSKGNVKSETLEDGTEKRGDLINSFGSAYNSIALMLAEVTEDAIESSVREDDKTRYSHTTPNYLGKLIKSLKNEVWDEQRFKDFVQEEFGQYDWFFKDGRWRNDWLEQLVKNPEMRKGLQHKVLINVDKVPYTKWDDLDYTLVLLTEYFGDPGNTKSDVQWANYHVPLLSDSPSAEFIRFRKYDNHSIMGEDGNYMKYDDIILDKLVNLVNQEVDRIALINRRDEEYQKGNPNIAPIANYDIIRNDDGTIKNIGGAEFKFLPSLNNVRFEDGKTFLERFQDIQNIGNGVELRDFIRETLREAIDNEFEETFKEWHRIGLLDEQENGKYKHLSVIGISNGQKSYDKNTASSLHKAKQVLGSNWTPEMDNLLGAYNSNTPVDNRQATTLFENIKDLLAESGKKDLITKPDMEKITKNLVVRNNAKTALREYFWNSKLATSQIIQLTTTDLAFYKDVEDFQKRYKEVHSPALRLNTASKYGRKMEKTLYLKDSEIVSNSFEDIKEVLDVRVKKGEMSSRDRDFILSKFRNVNVADAQAYRSLSSYRAILDMSGQWTDEMQKAFDNFQNGKWDISDFNIIWQTKKPFVYTQKGNMSGVEGVSNIKTPVQHKNSEFLLMAMYGLVANSLGKSEKLKAINEFMEKNDIDVIQFESTVKVGKQGVVDISDLNSHKEVMKVLNPLIGNPNVIHSVSYEDYGIQTATPEHSIDAIQLIGTQIRKLITADISDDPNLRIEVDGRKMTKAEWLKFYNAINTENIIQAFAEVDKIFKDPKLIEKFLLEEIRSNPRYGIDMVRAVTLNEDGQFNIPLFDPVVSLKVQTLLNSIIKNKITKQKIRGGALIMVSNFGLTDELKVVYEGEGENKRIKYMECYMPAYSKKFFEPLMKDGTHELDINKLPESLRKLIGYRVPTEDKYSMAPLYIKGFLPQQNGSSIMLPSDITTISGADFDVDKMYIMLPEFKVINNYDRERFSYDLVHELTKGKPITQEMFKEYSQSVFEALSSGKRAPKGSQENNIWLTYQQNKNKYKLEPTIEKVEYDWSKSPKENSLEARNNILIDMMWGVLTNPDTASKILNPGGFDDQKRSARIITILQAGKENELKKALGVAGNESVYSKLKDMSLEQLNKLADKFKKRLDPLNPRTQVVLHQQNMTGAALIGIYANHNASHALIQHTKLGVSVENGSFLLNGKRLTSLHNIKNDSQKFISRNNAGFLAASVDNAKDPVLAALNQNSFTADASMLLSRLGYESTEIGLVMTQPIVIDITNAVSRQKREGKSKDTIINEVLSKYSEKASIMTDLNYSSYKSNKFMAEDLADNIILQKEMEGLTDRSQTSDYRKVVYYKNQVAVGVLFQRIMKTADSLGLLVQATRADTPNGAAGPTIADTMVKILKVEDFMEKVVLDPLSPLVGAEGIINILDTKDADVDKLREMILNTDLPFLQAFYTLGMQKAQEMIGRYFPHFGEPFMEVIRNLTKLSKNERLDTKTINGVYNELLAYIMSSTDFFGSEINWDTVDENGNPTEQITNADKRNDFINNFPDYFKKVLNENPKLAELEFIKRLKYQKKSYKNPIDTVVFKNVGKLSPILKERYMRDWQSLLYMGPEAQQLALNLFRYSYYRNGFAFGPNSFIHLAPVAVRLAIPEYVSTLRRLIGTEDDYTPFVEQYVRNHLDNRSLVPQVDIDPEKYSITRDNIDELSIEVAEPLRHPLKSIVKDKTKVEGEIMYSFFPYIGMRYKGKFVYYRLVPTEGAETNVANYVRVTPLGIKNYFIEYEYGKDAFDVPSVVSDNNRDPFKIVTSKGEVIEYEESEMPDIPEIPDYVREVYEVANNESNVAQEAMSLVYGVPVEYAEDNSNNLDSYEPNYDYKDANDEQICR